MITCYVRPDNVRIVEYCYKLIGVELFRVEKFQDRAEWKLTFVQRKYKNG